jgi:hypothetical protein
MDFADTLQQQFRRCLLGHDAAATLSYCFDEVFFGVFVRQHDHARLQLCVLDSGEDTLAGGRTGRPTQQNNVWPDRAQLLNRPGCRVRSPDDFEVLLDRKQILEAIPENASLIYQKKSNF